MNCTRHPDLPAVTECVLCRKSFCSACIGNIGSEPVCTNCAQQAVSRYKESTDSGSRLLSPAAAAWLAVIPCIGAVYNGTYLKALYQFLGFVFISELLPLHLGFSIPATFVFYVFTIIDAYRTAKAIRAGEYNPEPLPFEKSLNANIIKGFVLVLLGVLFLLNNMDFDLTVVRRFWPIVLIAIGIYLVFARKKGDDDDLTSRSHPPQPPKF